jgi:L-fuculose-phosphate aldolase
MANHGLVTVGADIQSAFKTAEALELVARLYYQARCIGKPVILDDAQMGEVLRKFGWYSRPQ